MVVLDPRALEVTSRWPLAPCEDPSGMAIDQQHRRLFVGCGNKLMAVINADTGKVVTTLPIGEGVDANAFDPGTRLAFSSNGEGTLTVVHEDSPDRLAAAADDAEPTSMSEHRARHVSVARLEQGLNRSPRPSYRPARPHSLSPIRIGLS